jgi:hypothetical protein
VVLPAVVAEFEQIDQLGAPGRLADPGQPPPSGHRVEGARFAGVRSAGESDLAPGVRWQLGKPGDAPAEVDARITIGVGH